MNRRPRPVWPVVAAAQADPPGQRPWRLRHLLLAPHRLAFALALLLLLSTAAWWVLVQVDRLAGVPGLPYALSPALGHAAVMTFGFMPLFFSGFLFTAGPKWLGVAPLQAAALLAPLLLQTVGWLLWLLGLHLGLGLALAGLAAALSGLVWVGVLFWRLLLRSTVADRLHAKAVGVAFGLGVLSLALLLAAVFAGAHGLARVAVLSGLWGFCVLVFVVVAHRMLPFFTSSAVPMANNLGPFWMLWIMWAALALELLAVWLQWAGWHIGAHGRVWMLWFGLLQLAAGSMILWLAFVWGLVQSLRIRLLAMLHLGFLWLGLSFMLAGASQLLGLRLGTPVLGLGALHALTMGALGSLMLAMVTRVVCGHSGRALVADNLVWGLFWLLQVAVLLRIAAALPQAPFWLMGAAALLWALVMAAWGLRLLSWLGRLRADGRPG
ncbi:NnrS family protein [Hydrogenophaga sp.]|uniref:NnrS family protein n=1 Tax=Hydrogenophaga sp. TaxID=1904254 RepID=UPI0025C3820F|nr:NnrS family protein [Hydrogenophaga sp.]